MDRGHTVYAHRLAQHLKICSKRRQEEILVRQPFYRKAVNCEGPGRPAETFGDQAELDGAEAPSGAPAEPAGEAGEADAAAREALVRWLGEAFPRAVAEVLGASTDAEALLERSVVATPGNIAHAEKHEAQNTALTALVTARRLARDDPLVVEYGCGRAGLATALLAEQSGLRCVLLDRDSRRHKMENREEVRGQHTLRLRVDIADFDLAALLGPPLEPASLPRAADLRGEALEVSAAVEGHLGPAERLEELWKAAASLQSASSWPPRRLLACAKHLCGAATDIALRSLRGRPAGVAASVCIATCCHHRCDAASYINMPFLLRLGLGDAEQDFAQLASLAGWAVGGRGDVREKRRTGMMVKRILDLGRVAWLRETMGLGDANFAEYIGKEVTPENIAIIAGGVAA